MGVKGGWRGEGEGGYVEKWVKKQTNGSGGVAGETLDCCYRTGGVVTRGE